MFEFEIYDSVTYKLILVIIFTLIYHFESFQLTILVALFLFFLTNCTIIETKIRIHFNFNKYRIFNQIKSIFHYFSTEEFHIIIKTILILFPYYTLIVYIDWLEHKLNEIKIPEQK